jgi:HK97 family phage prohead protease
MKKYAIDEFREAARGRAPSDAMVLRDIPIAPVGQPANPGSRTKRFVFSDETVDRAKDVIKAGGWNLDNFLRNPTVLFAHRSDEPPIGRASNVGVVGQRLIGDIEFASADTYPLADTIFRLVKGGFLNAVSVGFRPLKFQFSKDPSRPNGIDFLESELLEVSVCPVPANPSALVQARAAGIEVARVSHEWKKSCDNARRHRMAETTTICAAARRMLRK